MTAGRDLYATMASTARCFGIAEIEARWSRGELRAATRAHKVARILPGLYADASQARSFAVRVDAATTWAGQASAATRTSALACWGLADPPSHLHVAVPHGDNRACPPWLTLVRMTRMAPVLEHRGVPVLGAAHAIAVGYGFLSLSTRDAMVYRAVQQGIASPRAIMHAMESLARVRSRRELARVVDAAARGAESWLEARSMSDVVNTPAFESLVRQHVVVVEGHQYRLDAYDPATRTAIELDGSSHGELSQRLRDIERDAMLLSIGIATVRFSYRDIVDRPEWCRLRLQQVLDARIRTGTTALRTEVYP